MPTADYDALVEACQQVLALHFREVERDALIPVEGGRATIREDVDYCAECGDLTGICPTAQLLEDALARVIPPAKS
jgi:ferredoxin